MCQVTVTLKNWNKELKVKDMNPAPMYGSGIFC